MKLKKYFKKDRVYSFLGGAVIAAVGIHAAKTEKAKDIAVKSLASGMRAHKKAVSTFQTIKEDAQDLCCEAKTVSEDGED